MEMQRKSTSFSGAQALTPPTLGSDPKKISAQEEVEKEAHLKLVEHIFQPLKVTFSHGNQHVFDAMKKYFLTNLPSKDSDKFIQQFKEAFTHVTGHSLNKESFLCDQFNSVNTEDAVIDGDFFQEMVGPVLIARLKENDSSVETSKPVEPPEASEKTKVELESLKSALLLEVSEEDEVILENATLIEQPQPIKEQPADQVNVRFVDHIFQPITFRTESEKIIANISRSTYSLIDAMKQYFLTNPPARDSAAFTRQFDQACIELTGNEALWRDVKKSTFLCERFKLPKVPKGPGVPEQPADPGWIDGAFLHRTVLPEFIARINNFVS